MATNEEEEEKGAPQNVTRRSILNVHRKSKESHHIKSLSTIAEEPKSVLVLVSDPHFHSDMSFAPLSPATSELKALKGKPGVKTPYPLPKLPEPLPPRKKKHISKLFRGTSKELVAPDKRNLSDSSAINDRLLSHFQVYGKPLFRTVINDQVATNPSSILVTGFGLRNLQSLQEALQIEEQNKLMQLYRAQADDSPSSSTLTGSTSSSQLSTDPNLPKNEATSETQTDPFPVQHDHKKKIRYLLGIDEGDEEEGEEVEDEEEGPALKTRFSGLGVEGELVKGAPEIGSEAMRQAQMYLRAHKIFEFFQFIIAHLLSALPENPIEFIIDLLHKCLIYRAGLTEPPLLYEKKHLECLFYLMDKMRTGYIEIEQYKTGMRTLGLCSFRENPSHSIDGMITKEEFINEGYQCQSDLLNQMLKRRWIRTAAPICPTPPPTPQISASHVSDKEGSSINKFSKCRLLIDAPHNL